MRLRRLVIGVSVAALSFTGFPATAEADSLSDAVAIDTDAETTDGRRHASRSTRRMSPRAAAVAVPEVEGDSGAEPFDRPALPPLALPSGTAEVAVAPDGSLRRAGDLPVRVAADVGALPEGARATVEVLTEKSAELASPTGFAFRVSLADADGKPVAPVESGRVIAELDYAAVAARYGGDFSRRVGVRRVPECALTADAKDCLVGEFVPTVINDFDGETLTVDLSTALRSVVPVAETDPPTAAPLPAAEPEAPENPSEASSTSSTTTAPTTSTTATTTTTVPVGAGGEASASGAMAELGGSGEEGGGAMFALSSGPSGENGDYAATPVAGVGQASVGVSAGSADVTYPIAVPPPVAGPTPEVEFQYSSASVDGFTTDRNTQPSDLGMGWSMNVGAIERQYEQCAGLGDSCWDGEQYTLSLNGVSGRLVPMDIYGIEWRLEGDPDWRVKRELRSDLASLDKTFSNNGAYFTVETPDGTKYTFGAPDAGTGQDSLWYAQVYNDQPGDPCYNEPYRMCRQGWHWALDEVEDRSGNTIKYFYDLAENFYNARNGAAGPWQGYGYIANGQLERIEYTTHGSTNPRNNIVFTYNARCTGGCTIFEFPDTPWDLWCAPGISTSCTQTSMSFWTAEKLAEVNTYVNDDLSPLALVSRYQLTQSFPDPGDTSPPSGVSSAKKMRLDKIRRSGAYLVPASTASTQADLDYIPRHTE